MEFMKSGSYTPEVNERRRQKLLRDKSPNWKGDSISYSTAHLWLRAHHIKTGICKKCKEKKYTEWALKKGRKYTRHKKDYFELCRSCHRRYDDITNRGWVTRKAHYGNGWETRFK